MLRDCQRPVGKGDGDFRALHELPEDWRQPLPAQRHPGSSKGISRRQSRGSKGFSIPWIRLAACTWGLKGASSAASPIAAQYFPSIACVQDIPHCELSSQMPELPLLGT